MRKASKERNTKETEIFISLNLDGDGKCEIDTKIGFLDHMFTLLAVHSGFDLKIKAMGDLEVDNHHTVEDIGIVFGEVLKEALGDKKGIKRYGTFFLPHDDVLARVSLDLGGRGYLVYDSPFTCERIGHFETETLEDFLYAFASNSRINLNIKMLDKGNNHHMAEAIFKALGRALKEAVTVEGDKVPSSKGVL